MIDTIRIDGLSVLHAKPDCATARPVLFVHGYYAAANVWSDWLQFFAARGVPAYAVNLRGRAGSKPVADLGRVSVADYADDAASVARAVGGARGGVSIVGHSMGGLIAQRVAAMGIVKAAALITPAPPRGIVLLNLRMAARNLKFLPEVLLSRVMVPNLGDLRALALNCAPPAIQETALARMVPDSGLAAREMSITGLPVDRSAVTCPILVIAAENDHFVPRSVVARVARRYGAELDVIPGRGHMVVIEPGWERLAERVHDWLCTHPAR